MSVFVYPTFQWTVISSGTIEIVGDDHLSGGDEGGYIPNKDRSFSNDNNGGTSECDELRYRGR